MKKETRTQCKCCNNVHVKTKYLCDFCKGTRKREAFIQISGWYGSAVLDCLSESDNKHICDECAKKKLGL